MKEQRKNCCQEQADMLVQAREAGDIFTLMFPDTDSRFEEIGIRSFYQRELKMFSILRRLKSITARDMKTVRDSKRGEVFMIDRDEQEALRNVGSFLLDVARLKSSLVLPGNGEEMQSLVAQITEASITGEPIRLFTPFCPDWSRDSKGRYDFKSLGGEVSYIAQKFFSEGKPLLSAFAKNKIPYRGELIFADWGLETEIDARDTYGRKLTQEDIQTCFASTLANTDGRLLYLQNGKDGILFMQYRIIPMTDFYKQQGVDPERIYRQQEKYFRTDPKGIRLVDEVHRAGIRINRERFGLNEEENRSQAIQNLAEYATLGEAFGDKGIIIAAESNTSTRAYNLPKQRKLPVFFIKSKASVNEGVNIL